MGIEHSQCRNMQVIKVPVYLYCVLKAIITLSHLISYEIMLKKW